MSEQTTFSTADRDESDSRTADEATSDRSARRNSTDDAQIDILQSETITQWVTDREDANESYGYFHLYVAAQSDLSGVQRALCWETRIEHATDDAGEPSPRFGTGGSRDTITAAFEYGSYEIPHELDTEELATEFDISNQALFEHLRRGHKALVKNTLMIGPNGSNDDRDAPLQRP